MTANSLRDELMALPGVAEAEVDASGQSPSGVKVRLAADADAKLVGVEVQRVLASHGMRSRVSEYPEDGPTASDPQLEALRSDQPAVAAALAGSGEATPLEPTVADSGGILPNVEPIAEIPEVPQAPEEAAPMTGIPTNGHQAANGQGTGAAEPVQEAVATPPPVETPVAVGQPMVEPSVMEDALVPTPLVAAPAPPVQAPPSAVAHIDLAALRVDETPEGVAVTATTTDGRSMTQRSGPDEEGLFQAIVAAVGSLADGVPPSLLSVERTGVNGDEVMTVIVERTDGRKAAGATVTRAGRGYAVARATWSALRS